MTTSALAPSRPVPYGDPAHTPAPITRRVDDVALVFEGGGMRGTYTAALVQVLLEEGLFFPWVGGISAGTTNTVNMVSRDLWRTREAFVGLTTDPDAGGWGSFARGQGYFNSEHIYQHTSLPDELFPFDWDTFKSSAATVRLGAFRCDTGEEVYWGLEDMDVMEDLLVRCQASSSMPVLMPTVHIDGVPYLDGALGPTGGFPTDAAAADGYERMLVVSTRPAGYRKPAEKRAAAYRRMFRRQPEVAEAIINRPDGYNRTIEELEQGRREGRVYLFQPDRMAIENGELRYDRVVSAYEAGLAQARRELPDILEFLGF
ncbi:MAG: patatin family protein [Actinomyces succiniciruminis]|uniref:Phospholipase, patatin n=1 Tax=Actinomyces succiniciruminis TaxID=1522002 RepID=A0A1L7RSI8_9ACTO|nr:patatin family protein [Actinomyces succiniciruminis]MBE6476265.1 patatin family protein [Actinomyces succiniciruminis]MBM6978206.1 patatin family protein [Actinomyces succiniciruminis]CED92726.1 Phospholipase, patatin [Actinomyces succiniciruminis]